MRSFRFLMSRRWVLFAVAIVVIGYATWWLGEWQFGRLEDRKADNSIVRTNENIPATPVAEVLAPGREVGADDEWRVVTATGTYDTSDTVVVRYRTRDGESGIDVVVPLVTADGTSLLVDRGWMAADNRGADPGDVPAPPAGEVTVTGWVRVDGTGDSTRVSANSTRAISSQAIGDAQGRAVYGGFIDLESESPQAAQSLAQVELPELDNGPHFFYGLQWWFFGVLAIFGFFYLMYDEWRGGAQRRTRTPRAKRVRQTNHPYARMKAEAAARAAAAAPGSGGPDGQAQSERSDPPSTGSITPETYDAAGDSRKAAARPNSSGSP